MTPSGVCGQRTCGSWGSGKQRQLLPSSAGGSRKKNTEALFFFFRLRQDRGGAEGSERERERDGVTSEGVTSRKVAGLYSQWADFAFLSLTPACLPSLKDRVAIGMHYDTAVHAT